MAMPTNNPNEIQVVVTMVDKMSAEMTAMRQHVERQLNATAATGKKVTEQTNGYAHKQSQRLKELAYNAVGVAGAIVAARVAFNQFAIGLKDAGIQTKGVQDSWAQIRATLANELKPEIQSLFDYISDNAQPIAQNMSNIVHAIMIPFKAWTAGALGIMGSIEKIKGEMRAIASGGSNIIEKDGVYFFKSLLGGEEKLKDQAAAKEMYNTAKTARSLGEASAQAYYDGMNDMVDKLGSMPIVKLMDMKTIEANRKKNAPSSGGGESSAFEIPDFVITQRQSAIGAMSVQRSEFYKTEILASQKLVEELSVDSSKVVAAEISDAKKRAENEEWLYSFRQSLREKDAENAKKLSEMHQDYFWQTATTFGATLVNMGQAARANAEDMKALRIAAALIDGAAAIAGVWRVAMSVSTPYEAAGWAVALTALSAANTAAQVAMISSQSFAMGGNAREGWATVGEHGPEKVYFGQDARVFDANATRTMQMGGGAGTTITFNIQPGATVDNTSVQTIERLLIRADREGRLEQFKSRIR